MSNIGLLAKGALLVGTGTQNSPVTVGSNGQALLADSTKVTGLAWSTATFPVSTTINRILYSSANNVIAELATANSGVLTTSATGVPSIDTTNFQVLTTGVQMRGNNTNTAPPSGFVGQQIKSTLLIGSATSLVTATSKNVTSISLTAGIWDVSGIVGFSVADTTVVLDYTASISATTNTLGGNIGDDTFNFKRLPGGLSGYSVTITIPQYRISLSSTTTYYLVANSTFNTSTAAAYGRITATRVG